MSAPRIMISAGEASGDRLGAGVAEALLRRRPDVELVGMGGERMAAAGVRILQDSAEVAVVGIIEVLAHLPAVWRAMRRLESALHSERPDVLVPIDFPDFNLRLSRRARNAGVPVVYFVSPQVWAWRRGRVRAIRDLVRKMLVLFPFETGFYQAAGVPVSFVGHPLADRGTGDIDAASLREGIGLDRARPVVGLLPGSRASELERLLEPMLGAASILQRQRPELQFLLSVAPGLSRDRVAERVARSGIRDLVMHTGDFPEILEGCAAGVVASGTASLEAATVGLPLVVVYRMNALTYRIGRALVRVDHIALPNLVAGRRIVPELVQGECEPRAIADALAVYLDDPDEARRVREELLEVRQKLGEPGLFDRVAAEILAELPG